MRVFVAGGTGAVGRRLVPLLVRDGHVVAGVSRTDEGVRRLRSCGADGRVADIADRSAIIEAVATFRPDVIAHQVTDLRHLDLDANATIRRLGTRNLVDAAHTAGVRRIVAQSISWAYEAGEMPAVESDRLDLAATEPRLTTVRGIADSEAFVAEVPEFVILRYGMFYGPDTFFAAGHMMAREAHAGRLVGDDSITNFVHVDDAADAANAALDWEPGVANIGDDEPAAASDWMTVLADAVGAAAPTSRVGRPGWARGADNTHPPGRRMDAACSFVAAPLQPRRLRCDWRTHRCERPVWARLRGKQPKLSPKQEAHLVALHAAGEHTNAELAELFSIGRSTVYRALDRGRGRTSA